MPRPERCADHQHRDMCIERTALYTEAAPAIYTPPTALIHALGGIPSSRVQIRVRRRRARPSRGEFPGADTAGPEQDPTHREVSPEIDRPSIRPGA